MGITTDAQFWKGLSENDDFIDEIALPDDEAKARVVRAMSRFAIRRARSIMKSRARSRFYNVLFLLVLAMFALLFYRDYGISHVLPSPHVVVTNPNGLAPFHVISQTDIGVSCDSKKSSESPLIDDLIGRYAKQFVASCSVLDPSALSHRKLAPGDFNQRLLLSLSVQQTSVVADVQPPFEVGLLAAPRGTSPKSLFIANVYILDLQLEANDMRTVISVAPSDFDALMAFSGHGDFFLVGPAH